MYRQGLRVRTSPGQPKDECCLLLVAQCSVARRSSHAYAKDRCHRPRRRSPIRPAPVAASCSEGQRENLGSVPPVAEISARGRTERLLLGLYLVLSVVPFVWAALTRDDFWSSVAPFSTLLAFAVLLALWRGHRWAWVLLVLLDAVTIVSYLWDPAGVVILVMATARLGLLLSPPIRSYVGSRHRWPRPQTGS